MFSLRTLAGILALAPAVLGQSLSSELSSLISSLKNTNYGTTLGSTCACDILALVAGEEKVLFPNSTAYTAQNTHYYTTRADLAPKCIFVPATVTDVSIGVVVLDTCQSQFAVRGAGHMVVKGAANTDGGVLVALSSFTDVVVSEDASTVSVGGASNWYQVNSALVPYGRGAIGGRLKTIGVGGLTLGGGISYFSAKYGFAMDTVVNYEVVLASGQVVNANATSYSDLFWALKGGSNNFGIVTTFTYATISVPAISSAIIVYTEDVAPQFVSAIADFANYQPDVDLDAGGIFDTTYTTSGGYSPTLLGVKIGDELEPEIFANFSAIPNELASYNITNLADWAAMFDTPYQQQRWMYGMHTMVADNATMQELYSMWATAVHEMDSVNGFQGTVTFQPLPKTAFAVAANNGIGNAWGHDDTENYVFWLLSTAWLDAADDETVMTWAENTREAMQNYSLAAGVGQTFIYMNDAADNQDAIGSYPAANIAKLQSIRSKYDPNLVFTNLETGGYKIPN